MSDTDLNVTFRHGRAFAAYYHVAGAARRSVARSQPCDGGLVVDFGEDGRPLGIEITAPTVVTLDGMNAVLAELGLPAMDDADFAPLSAA